MSDGPEGEPLPLAVSLDATASVFTETKVHKHTNTHMQINTTHVHIYTGASHKCLNFKTGLRSKFVNLFHENKTTVKLNLIFSIDKINAFKIKI